MAIKLPFLHVSSPKINRKVKMFRCYLIVTVLWIFSSCASPVSASPGENHRWQVSTRDGQPGCRTRYEFTRFWRNNHQSGQYWECVSFGVPATIRNCPPATLFQDYWQTCVPETMYQWTPTYDAPSSPGDLVGPCQDWVENSVTECPPCVVETTTTTTLCPPCEIDSPGREPEHPFQCNNERYGILWTGPTVNTYWECETTFGNPLLKTCQFGNFVFPMQMCQ